MLIGFYHATVIHVAQYINRPLIYLIPHVRLRITWQATAPLLRQITTLQESLRLKSDAWQHIETTLSERALRAETLAESHVHKRSLLEEQVHSYQAQAQSLTTRLQDLQARLDESETLCHKYQRNEATLLEEQHEWRAKWTLQEAQHQSLLSSMRDLEAAHKVALQEVQERSALQVSLLFWISAWGSLYTFAMRI